ncbi:WXG100 family type VII secretion target [Streptomyces sp. FH025]|uniref:WXG100 family type VII secretion target n=1 Tax=Streptomyces sp. FH025 TaxID=2815937 RepID=UPI001A9CC2A4|nr:WXG100 family type VII secretion target [Streptomyces sp. FH025]MBO1417170.1 WXG100 family type VII secretion target [Streptomyces sp. FH025]
MSDHILVNFQTLHQASQDVQTSANKIEQMLSDLRQDVTKIAQSWQGQAQQGYNAQQTKWDQAASDLKQTCAKIAGSLEQAAVSYQQTETKNAGLWG